MPIRYRHYYIKKITDHLEKQNEIMSKENGQADLTSKPLDKVQVPDFVSKVGRKKKD